VRAENTVVGDDAEDRTDQDDNITLKGLDMSADEQTLGEEIIRWIEATCRVPRGCVGRLADSADGLAEQRDPQDLRQFARDKAVHHQRRQEEWKNPFRGVPAARPPSRPGSDPLQMTREPEDTD
jgi:hypothetical protein